MEVHRVQGLTVRLFGPVDEESASPVLWLIHGAGMSSASFIPLATLLTSAAFASANGVGGDLMRCAAVDLRCHGDSTRDGGEEGLTLPQLVDDVVAVILEASQRWFSRQPRVFLAGHSLGGSVAVRAAHRSELKSKIGGLVMLDIVEETARQSLRHMQAYLDNRPTSFCSADAAIAWFLHKGGMRSERSARLTVPFLLSPVSAGTDLSLQSGAGSQDMWRWKTNLADTQQCWSDWFTDLDMLFLALPCPKMLMLAGTDRLDKSLTIGHMQGKFQMEVISGVGHYLHEDDPATVAAKLLRFVVRVDTLLRKLPAPK